MTTASTATHAYIGIHPCGCVRAVAVDDPEDRPWVSKNVAGFLKWGTVERIPIDDVKTLFCFVKHGKKGECPHPNACPYRSGGVAVKVTPEGKQASFDDVGTKAQE